MLTSKRFTLQGTCRRGLALLALMGVLASTGQEALAIEPEAFAMEPAAGPAVAAEQLERFDLELRSGRIFQLETPASAVFVADPTIADVQAHSPSLFYVFGKKTGKTTIYAVDDAESVIFQKDIIVTHSVGRLSEVLGQALPGADVRVTSLDSGIVLTGFVTKPVEARDAEDLARRFLGEGEIVLNRLEIRGSNQVNVRVRVAEIARDADKALGIHWDAAGQFGDMTFNLLTGRSFLTDNRTNFIRSSDQAGEAGTFLGGFNSDDVAIDGIIDALEREGLVAVLAEPNLTALSGETASFLAGGEFPVPVGRDQDEVQIEFKEFGVRLAFTPTVLGNDRISLRVKPEVSDLDFANAIELVGTLIPALRTRRAETTVELGSGQSFAIGGLISNSTQNNLQKMPGLGDLPVLGPLFRSTSFQRSESELVIIVTPYLVRPVRENELRDPTEQYRAATDLQRIIEGRLTKPSVAPGAEAPAMSAGGRLIGPAGFLLD
ncbi:MAG: type II and III secretion system protein family protein [Geminicoccaceae bacterium]|nr:type II and III secretion system protein family protein [Geminicoccaceae bacterium]